MSIVLNPFVLEGELSVPASKSLMQRVCAAALLHQGTTIISNAGNSDDERAALQIVNDLGAVVSRSGDKLIIKGVGTALRGGHVHCGESGLAARLFTPIASLCDQAVTVNGGGSLVNRPMEFFSSVLPALGVELHSPNGHLPLTVCGPLHARDIEVDGALSSQFISGLLFAFAASANGPVTLRVKDLSSKPYIDLTLDVLQFFGKAVSHQDYHSFYIDPSRFVPHPHLDYTVEGDWSSASFWIAAASLSGSIALKGLDPHSLQADRKILSILQASGAAIRWEDSVLHVSKGPLKGFTADLKDSPDLFPVLSVLAASCSGQSRLTGLHRLIHKESNRSESIQHLLRCLNVHCRTETDTLVIEGRASFPTITYEAPNDHRMVMAAALAALNAPNGITILNASAVNKSYPGFWEHIARFAQ